MTEEKFDIDSFLCICLLHGVKYRKNMSDVVIYYRDALVDEDICIRCDTGEIYCFSIDFGFYTTKDVIYREQVTEKYNKFVKLKFALEYLGYV